MSGTERAFAVLVTAEHASARIPSVYRPWFQSAEAQAALGSHRGFDGGAGPVARLLGHWLKAQPVTRTYRGLLGRPRLGQVSRLLVDLNRSEKHPALLGPWVPKEAREALVARFHRPHREACLSEVQGAIAEGLVVRHCAVHSFTPVLDGDVRRADLGVLYDPGRDHERRWADAVVAVLRAELGPSVRVRRNYPYRGVADGLPTWLRRHTPRSRYLGIELEVNQAFFERVPRAALADALGQACRISRPR